jgi:hypothetical protein
LTDTATPPQVKHFRQVLLWPLRLLPVHGNNPGQDVQAKPWQVLRKLSQQGGSPWAEVIDEYTGDPEQFHERHYNEFVTFLPYVQRFLYGEGRAGRRSPADGPASQDDRDSDSPMRVFRRKDVAKVRVQPRPGDAPIELDIVHTDLYFFLDVDLVLLNLEVSANDLTLAQAQELLYRFGRGYPAGWDAKGLALHSMASVQWLGTQGCARP